MEISGYAGLIAVFGGTQALWKQRLSAGMPVLDRQSQHAGKSNLYDSVAVYQWVCERSGGAKLDPQQERARLDRARRRLAEQQLAVRKGNLIPAQTVEHVWGQMTGAARQRLLAVPYRMAQVALAADSFAAVETAAAGLIREALEELHRYQPNDYRPDGPSPERRRTAGGVGEGKHSEPIVEAGDSTPSSTGGVVRHP